VWLVATSAWGQQPTPAQVSALRQACRADFQAQCAGVPAGGQAALACLERHSASLSPDCGSAVEAVAGGARAPAAAAANHFPEAAGLPAEAQWPHTITEGQATATIYEPQVVTWPGQTSIQVRVAVQINRAPGAPPILGVLEATADTRTDFAQRWVIFSNVRITATHFPTLDTAHAAALQQRIASFAAALDARRVPLDSVLLSLRNEPAEAAPVATNDTAPVIFHSESPASLVVFDGEPVLAPIGQTGLSLAVNTNWSMVTDGKTGRWYLLVGDSWLAAPAYTGPYQPVSTLPPAFAKLPEGASTADIRRHVPARPFRPGGAPTVFVSTKPAEIIVTDGPARLEPVRGAPLRRVANSSAEVIYDPAGATYYVLFAGRWFSAPGLEGPWRYATPDLPASFALLPPDGPDGHLLASVPGTAQAQEAVISAGIPRQATLKRSTTPTPVVYIGAPQFKPIAGTDMAYAVNTAAQVLRVGGKYYLCENGAWFVATSPTGPWVLADTVPPEIYTIPPSNPLYPVTYVKVYGATPETVVVGYTSGYTLGVVSTAGVVVYGTGYTYPPVVLAAPVPVYLPYPYTYADGVTYYSTTGTWARTGGIYGPYGAAVGGTYYNPATGAYAGGGAIYGPYGGAGAWSAYNPQTGAYAHGSASWSYGSGAAYASFGNPATGRSGSTTQNWNPYERWGSSTVSGPSQTVHTESGSSAGGSAGAFSSSTGAEGAGYHGAGGNTGGAVRTQNGDVYAGHNGNVYQHSDSGWSKWSNGGWQSVTPPSHTGTTTTAPQHQQLGAQDYDRLQQDRQARQGGAFRQRMFQSGGGLAGRFGGTQGFRRFR
jgi:hypothetical protein